MAGFTFNGVHSASLGCQYHPDARARGDRMAAYAVKDLTDESRDGGYYLGARVEPKAFALACYFEEITEGQQAHIRQWLRRDTQGELIFDDRLYAIYDVVTTQKPDISLYDCTDAQGVKRYSGTFEAHFTAYEPFARMREVSCAAAPDAQAMQETGIQQAEMMPTPPSAQTTSFLIYNPGTEAAHTIIRVTGDAGDGVIIRNFTTGQRCKIVHLKDSSLLAGAVLELDSAMGQTRIVLGEEKEMAFSFHDEGYITLAPCMPFMRDVTVTHTQGSNTVSSDGCFHEKMEGQYLYIDGWKRIAQVTDENTATIVPAAEYSGSTVTPIVTMNELEMQGENAALTHFEIEYVPRVE